MFGQGVFGEPVEDGVRNICEPVQTGNDLVCVRRTQLFESNSSREIIVSSELPLHKSLTGSRSGGQNVFEYCRALSSCCPSFEREGRHCTLEGSVRQENR